MGQDVTDEGRFLSLPQFVVEWFANRQPLLVRVLRLGSCDHRVSQLRARRTNSPIEKSQTRNTKPTAVVDALLHAEQLALIQKVSCESQVESARSNQEIDFVDRPSRGLFQFVDRVEPRIGCFAAGLR